MNFKLKALTAILINISLMSLLKWEIKKLNKKNQRTENNEREIEMNVYCCCLYGAVKGNYPNVHLCMRTQREKIWDHLEIKMKRCKIKAVSSTTDNLTHKHLYTHLWNIQNIVFPFLLSLQQLLFSFSFSLSIELQ